MRICYGEVHEIIGRNLQLIMELYKSEKKEDDNNLPEKKKSEVESSGGPKSGVAAFSARRADILIKEAQVQEFF